jgi:hypothetical protein
MPASNAQQQDAEETTTDVMTEEQFADFVLPKLDRGLRNRAALLFRVYGEAYSGEVTTLLLHAILQTREIAVLNALGRHYLQSLRNPHPNADETEALFLRIRAYLGLTPPTY